MFEQLLSSPLIAVGFLVLVVYMAAVYFTQKERAKVHHMKGRKGFTPKWSSGRRHRARRRAGAEGRFQPGWDRERPRSARQNAAEPIDSKSVRAMDVGDSDPDPGEDDGRSPSSL